MEIWREFSRRYYDRNLRADVMSTEIIILFRNVS